MASHWIVNYYNLFGRKFIKQIDRNIALRSMSTKYLLAGDEGFEPLNKAIGLLGGRQSF
jgi:hypothetical protein